MTAYISFTPNGERSKSLALTKPEYSSFLLKEKMTSPCPFTASKEPERSKELKSKYTFPVKYVVPLVLIDRSGMDIFSWSPNRDSVTLGEEGINQRLSRLMPSPFMLHLLSSISNDKSPSIVIGLPFPSLTISRFLRIREAYIFSS